MKSDVQKSHSSWNKGIPMTEQKRKELALARHLKLSGRKLTEEHKKALSESQKGRKLTLEQRKRISEYQKGRHLSVETRKKQSVSLKKYNLEHGIGGKTKEADKMRNSLEYKLWREAVFQRDNFTCQGCGDNHGGNLEADHIKPKSLYPELIFAIDNGRTLCTECHKQTETWGYKLFNYKKIILYGN